jgi:hypothetical protein
MPRKPRKPSQPTRAKKRKTTPSDDANWPARSLGRRQVLKGVVAGSGVVASALSLPKEWSKPVVQSIVASAQAQVSPAPFSPIPIPSPLAPTFPLGPIPIPIPVTPLPPLPPVTPMPVLPPSLMPIPIPIPVPF